jgi:type IV pilus assembly protein PilY1
MNSRISKGMLLAALAIAHCVVHAEDIDLFVGAQPGASERPNVLFIIDNTANWTAAFDNEKQALVNTFRAIPVNEDGTPRFNVGVLFAAETSSSDSNVSGGYVRAAMRPMTGTATTPGTKDLYADMIAALDVGKDKGNGGASSLVMAEAYRYFTAGAPYAGNNKATADYTGNLGSDWSASATTLASLTAMQRIYALPGNALSSKSATRYNGQPGSQCGKNYIIYISNGAPQDSNQYTSQANTMLAAAGGDTGQIPLSPTGSQGNVSDEWARFMKKSLGVVTYAIDVDPSGTGQGPGWSKALWSMSEGVGGGKYIGVNSQINAGSQISDAVGKALSEIQAVNSVFASVSLPVSANTQGTFSNQVYIGMFRPHASAYPRWSGNLKQYRLGYVNGVLRLVDAKAEAAINPLTGFITECARSFWTPTTTDSYWAFRPGGECISTDSSNPNLFRNSNSPDGNIVEKGAHAYVLRSSAGRALKTCAAGACSTLTDFDAGNTAISSAQLGVTDAQRADLIDWARGRDLDNEDSNTTTTVRPSVHADVVHSRPTAIDFGTSSSPKVVVFYGGNDGVFRAVNGNQIASIDEPAPSTAAHAPGSELWGFVPPEFYGQFKRLRDNSLQIDFPNVTAPDAAPKPYGIDGPITAFRGSANTTILATMRRGGRALYAFDVPNDNPASFTLKWRKGCPTNFPVTGTVSDTGCSTDFSNMGQTWSSAKPLKAAGYGAGSSPMLIMGGGYDTCEDSDPHTCTSSSKGNKVYVLDGNSGSVLRTFDTDRPVIADATIVPDSAGLAMYAYTADLGGNVYRVTFGAGAPADWSITKIASLGCATNAGCPTNRKFMFAPDVLANNGEYIVLLGSGDREKPLLYYALAASVTNYFFMLRDRPSDSTWLAAESTTCGGAVLCLDSLLAITTSANPTPTALAAKKGWYLGLRSTEQVVTSAITIFGTVSFSTHTPDVPQVGVCTSRLGIARVYNISYLNAASQNGTPDRSEELPPDTGLPPSPVAGMVDVNGTDKAFCIGCGSTSSIEVEEPPLPAGSVPSQPKGRVYWYIER